MSLGDHEDANPLKDDGLRVRLRVRGLLGLAEKGSDAVDVEMAKLKAAIAAVVAALRAGRYEQSFEDLDVIVETANGEVSLRDRTNRLPTIAVQGVDAPPREPADVQPLCDMAADAIERAEIAGVGGPLGNDEGMKPVGPAVRPATRSHADDMDDFRKAAILLVAVAMGRGLDVGTFEDTTINARMRTPWSHPGVFAFTNKDGIEFAVPDMDDRVPSRAKLVLPRLDGETGRHDAKRTWELHAETVVVVRSDVPDVIDVMRATRSMKP
jgi:hypothetical protein